MELNAKRFKKHILKHMANISSKIWTLSFQAIFKLLWIYNIFHFSFFFFDLVCCKRRKCPPHLKSLFHLFKQRVVLLWTLDPAQRDAYLANEATKKLTASNWVLMEIACTRSSHHLLAVRNAYHAKYKKSIEEDVAHHTSGDFRKVIIIIISF